MKAKITQKQVSNGYSYWEKELVNTLTLVAVHKGEIVEPVVARFWMGRSRNASTVYCSIWINDRKTDTWASGKGTAGGWGYHRQSAALQDALNSAGVELYGDCYVKGTAKTGHYNMGEQKVDFKKRARISGVGDEAMKDAIEAIGRALGYRKFKVV